MSSMLSRFVYLDAADMVLSRIRTQREVVMMRIMNKVTDIPGWETWVCFFCGPSML